MSSATATKSIYSIVYYDPKGGGRRRRARVWNVLNQRWEVFSWLPPDEIMATLRADERRELEAFFAAGE